MGLPDAALGLTRIGIFQPCIAERLDIAGAERDGTIQVKAGAGEVAFTVENAAAVEATFADWKKRGLNILQEPVQMDFGKTFVATDPDGHRLRVFVPAAA